VNISVDNKKQNKNKTTKTLVQIGQMIHIFKNLTFINVKHKV